jgi:hypothetical protein
VRKLLLTLLLVAAPVAVAADDMDKYLEMLRSDLRTAKTTIHTEAVGLKGTEGDKFWPIQREYETELAKIGDQRIALIKDYAANYDSLTATKAKELINRAFKLESSRLALLKKYTDKITKGISPMVGARFAQIEAIINSLIDLQIRAETPLVP